VNKTKLINSLGVMVGAILLIVEIFGTPLAGQAVGQYAAKWADQLEGMSVKQGENVDVWVDVKNTGTATWDNSSSNAVKIGTIRPVDRVSKLYNSTWLSSNRVASITQSTVVPGEVGRFAFTITAKGPAGRYREYFGLVAEGITWFSPFYFYIEINILPATYIASVVSQSENPVMTPGGRATLWIDLRNDGNTAWPITGDNAVKLGTAGLLDRESLFYTSTWLSKNRVAVADRIVNPGEVGRFTFTIQAPDKIGKYRDSL